MPSGSPFPAGFAAAWAAAWAAALAAFRQKALALFACGREARALSCLLKLLEEPLQPTRAAPGGVRYVDTVFPEAAGELHERVADLGLVSSRGGPERPGGVFLASFACSLN